MTDYLFLHFASTFGDTAVGGRRDDPDLLPGLGCGFFKTWSPGGRLGVQAHFPVQVPVLNGTGVPRLCCSGCALHSDADHIAPIRPMCRAAKADGKAGAGEDRETV